jgi:hypothetical protein
MEYVAMHGAFDDVPLQRIVEAFALHYPRMPVTVGAENAGDFMADAARERTGRSA